MFKCYDCGKIFFEPKTIEQSHPYGMSNATEHLSACPYCNGSFDEAYPCKECEEYFFKDELHSFYCVDCLKENWNKPNDLFEFAESITTKGNINEFALEMWGGVDGVNEVLRFLLNTIFRFDCKKLKPNQEKYIEKYADELAEILEEQENEQTQIL